MTPFVLPFHVFSRDIGGRCGAEEAARGMSRMPLAGAPNVGVGGDSRGGNDRGSLSMGLLSWGNIPHNSVLARLGKVACQERRLCVVPLVWADYTWQPDDPALKSERPGQFVHSARGAIFHAFGRRHETASEPLNRWRSHSSLHELLATLVRAI